jgi:hypothetical protein
MVSVIVQENSCGTHEGLERRAMYPEDKKQLKEYSIFHDPPLPAPPPDRDDMIPAFLLLSAIEPDYPGIHPENPCRKRAKGSYMINYL